MGENDRDRFLPQTILGRILLGLLSAASLPLPAVMLFALVIGPMGKNPTEWFIRIAAWELCAAWCAVSLCGMTWALFTPAWLLPFAERCAKRLSLLLLLPFIVMAGMLIGK